MALDGPCGGVFTSRAPQAEPKPRRPSIGPSDSVGESQRLPRRQALKLLGAAGLAFLAHCTGADRKAPTTRTSEAEASDWENPATWGGSPPGPSDVVVISRKVTLRSDAHVAGVVIEPRGHLVFHPGRSVTLQSTGNVVVLGRLTMRPARPTTLHRLVFSDVDESGFVGGGMDVLDSDVGLWVMGAGVLDLAGAGKVPWTRTAGAVAPGATVIELERNPAGWAVGDEIVVTPTIGPSTADHFLAYDVATVDAIHGRSVTLSQPTRHDHPAVEVGRDKVMTAEVLNLTRNVGIEGTPGGRTHVFIRSSRPQAVKHIVIRHVGPRQPDEKGATAFVLGRYGIHFHHAEDGSRGSLVEGVVVRDAGSHSFVPHMSHGVTFRDCIAHDVVEGPYWWDLGDSTDETVWDHCVASLVQSDPPFRGYSLSGFTLGKGDGNVIRSCVSVGVQGNVTSSGFMWPNSVAEGIWTFEDNVAHNNRVLGIYTWQNTPNVHVVSRFIGYHNVRAGILHGAYRNPYTYEDSILYGNLERSLIVFALNGARTPEHISFHNVLFDGAGLHDYEVTTAGHALPAELPVRFVRCEFKGYGRAGFSLTATKSDRVPDLFSLEDCTYEANEFWLERAINPDAVVEVEGDGLGSIVLRRYDQPGTFVPEWNASVT